MKRSHLRSDPEVKRAFVDRARANSKRKRSAVSPASPEQREFVRDRWCLNCGAHPGEARIDPAHIISRGVLTEGQDEARAVIPLCATCHRAYDADKTLDLLPTLEADGWRTHLAFAVERYGLVRTLERVTNIRWTPDA